MKLTIKKEDGTTLIKEFADKDVDSAKELGWKPVGVKTKKKAKK